MHEREKHFLVRTTNQSLLIGKRHWICTNSLSSNNENNIKVTMHTLAIINITMASL